MKPLYDWTASTLVERVMNAALRPFGRDCFIERHALPSWQWGVDRPQATAQIGKDNVVALPGYTPHQTFDLWMGPFHIALSRV
jgi:hypothetical protein